jgi:hypothetical protein
LVRCCIDTKQAESITSVAYELPTMKVSSIGEILESPYSHFNEQVFRSSVDKALETVKQILEVNRKPLLAEKVDHQYEDKYELAESMTNIAIIAQLNCLEKLGLTPKVLKEIDQSQNTTLRFKASETCTFLKEQTVDVPMYDTYSKTEESQTTKGNSFFGSTSKTTIQNVVKHVKEYHWRIEVQWEISIISGNNMKQKQIVQNRNSSMIVVTQSKRAPIEEIRDHEPADLSLTWLLQQIDIEIMSSSFHIHRETAKTPRRNDQVENALQFLHSLSDWVSNVRFHFTVRLQQDIVEENNPVFPPASINSNTIKSCSAVGIFIPILPLMEQQNKDTEAPTVNVTTEAISSLTLSDNLNKGPMLPGNDYIKLLNEQVRSIEEKIQSLQRAFPSAMLVKIISVAEASVVVLCEHSQYLSHQYVKSITYMEQMLEDQLIQAIGKRVTAADLEEFARFHNSKLLSPPPKPFCHAIGQPNRYPFGMLSIEAKKCNTDSTVKPEPIQTMIRHMKSSSSLKVPLNAATTLELTGNIFLHGWMNHGSQQSSHKVHQLVARARQFSSFLLVIGTMIGSDRLQPKEAIILQNKDEVIIPLLLNDLPSAREFKDAIQSLSPEQRQFAESFRSMQLASSIFGVCVIQIKPQLEILLGLPRDSLTKQIKLTESLMELFIEYQVPSDLLSYDGDVNASTQEKIENVREHVQTVLAMIEDTKAKQLEEVTMKADMARESKVSEESVPMDGARRRHLRGPKKNMDEELSSGSMVFGSMSMPPPKMQMAKMAMPGNPTMSAYTPVVNEVSMVQNPATEKMNNSSLNGADFTTMPKALNASIEKYDKDNALRSTLIKTSPQWNRCRQLNLLTKPEKVTLLPSDVQSEKNKAFDLLDALSRSGSLPIAHSDLHVLLCVTHRFEKDIMATVVQDNINPIERLELSMLLLGSTIYSISPGKLISEESERQRLKSSFPALLE